MGSILFYYARKLKYQNLLYTTSFIALLIPIYVFVFPGHDVFFLTFLAGGVVYTLHKVSIDGVLLEVSTNENRALYTSLSGAGSLLPAIFPLVGGWIIDQFGFSVFFNIFIFLILLSIYFIYKLNCRK